MEVEILEGPNGSMTITTLQIFSVLWKSVTVPNDPHPLERGVYKLPLTVRINGGERRDNGLLVHAGYKLAIEAIVT